VRAIANSALSRVPRVDLINSVGDTKRSDPAMSARREILH
jgi:hypothetical protein